MLFKNSLKILKECLYRVESSSERLDVIPPGCSLCQSKYKKNSDLKICKDGREFKNVFFFFSFLEILGQVIKCQLT